MKKTAITILSLPLLCAVAFSQDQPSKALTANPVYQQNCAKCHGEAAEGRHFRGPSLLSSKTAAFSDDDLRTIIANGKHHMPKFGGKLGGGEIDALVRQIKSANTK